VIAIGMKGDAKADVPMVVWRTVLRASVMSYHNNHSIAANNKPIDERNQRTSARKRKNARKKRVQEEADEPTSLILRKHTVSTRIIILLLSLLADVSLSVGNSRCRNISSSYRIHVRWMTASRLGLRRIVFDTLNRHRSPRCRES
jgi:hypothetical protein